MESFPVVLSQLTQFFLMLMMGYAMAKIGVVHENYLGELARIVTKLLLPVFIFYSTYYGSTRQQVLEGIPVIAIAIGMYAALAVLFFVLAKVLGLRGERGKIFQALFIFGNIGFVGIPLIQALYPEEGMVYTALFSVVDQILLWTYGIWLTDSKSGGKIRIKNFVNPAIVAVVAAMAGILSGIRLPDILIDTAATVGRASTATCMIYLGALLYFSDLRKVLKSREMYVGIFVKQIAFPAAFWFVLRRMGLAPAMEGTMVLIAGLPTMTVIPMFAKNGGNEGEYAICVTMITLVTSLITLSALSLIAL